MEKLSTTGIVIFCVIALAAGGLLGYYLAPSEVTGLTEDEVNVRVSEAVTQAGTVKDTEIERLKGLIAGQDSDDGTMGNETSSDDGDDDDKVQIILGGYLLDELLLGSIFAQDVFSDRELDNFFDGEVEFDGDNYDAEETLIIKDFEIRANGNDYEGEVHMLIPRHAIRYMFEFEGALNTSSIDSDDTLEFDFLGDSVEISKWDIDEIIFSKGTRFYLKQGDSVEVDGKTVSLESVYDEKVYVTVNNVTKRIREGQTIKFGSIDVFAKEVDYQAYVGGSQQATLIIGKDIETEIRTGDEYEEDSVWEWLVTPNSIGIVLIEDFNEVDADDDEEFPALVAGDKLCLPNNYTCIQFNGMTDEDAEKYNLELDEKSGRDYVRINGKFISGIKDFTRIYVNSTGIYDKDLDLIDNNVIELDNTDSFLTRTANWIEIKDFMVNYGLNNSVANSHVLNSEDEDWLTIYGIEILNPEDSADDEKYTIYIPEEMIEGSVSII